MGSIALPALLRAGDTGQAQFSTGSVQKAQYPTSESQHSQNSYHAYPVSNVSVILVSILLHYDQFILSNSCLNHPASTFYFALSANQINVVFFDKTAMQSRNFLQCLVLA